MPAAFPQIAVPAVNLAVTLSGGIVLFLLDVWLRRKAVKDPTLIWLYLSLWSWSASAAAQLAPRDLLAREAGVWPDQVPYIASPVSSILFTITAFRLSRVRELFKREELRMWPPAVTALVSSVSLAAVVLLLTGQPETGKLLDAAASCLALIALGGGVLYSFYKYGNQLLGALAGITFLYLISRQFLSAAVGPGSLPISVLQVAGTTTFVMLLIALTVAWGLSETSRSRIVGSPAQVTIAAMIFDLRGSTQWSQGVVSGDYHYVGTFIDHLRAWAWGRAMEKMGERPSLVKFLGDGFLFVWEIAPNSMDIDRQTAGLAGLACALNREYPSWCRANSALWKGVPGGLGIGVDVGTAIRLTFENGSEDYVGQPINNAAKLQDAARPSGGVVMRAELCARLDTGGDTARALPRWGTISFPNEQTVQVCATDEVELRDPSRRAADFASAAPGP